MSNGLTLYSANHRQRSSTHRPRLNCRRQRPNHQPSTTFQHSSMKTNLPTAKTNLADHQIQPVNTNQTQPLSIPSKHSLGLVKFCLKSNFYRTIVSVSMSQGQNTKSSKKSNHHAPSRATKVLAC